MSDPLFDNLLWFSINVLVLRCEKSSTYDALNTVCLDEFLKLFFVQKILLSFSKLRYEFFKLRHFLDFQWVEI